MNKIQKAHNDDDALSADSRKAGKLGRPQSVTEQEKGDTFLTDMLFKGKTPSKVPKAPSSKPPAMSAKGKRANLELKPKTEDQNSELDSDEYQDIVFDINESKHMSQRADDFLTNKPFQAWGDDQSQVTEDGNKSVSSGKAHFI